MAKPAKLPPQNIEAEQSVLGSLLIDKDAILKVSEILRSGDFYRVEQHGSIYQAIIDLFEKRQPVDLVTITDELKKKGVYDEVGGSAYLTTLINSVPTSAHVEHYARIIKEHSVRRHLISEATVLIENSFNEEKPVSELLEDVESSIFAISQDHVKRDFIPIKEALAESFERLDELQKSSGKLRGVPSGFKDLDAKLAGFQDSNLIILAARPGQGKTGLALNIAQHVAVKLGLPVGFFSLEMSKEELVDRLLVGQADIDAWKLKTGRFSENDKDWEKLSLAMGELAEAPIYIDDTPGLSISEMRTKARRLQMEHGLKFIMVDYLQLMRGRTMDNRVQEVSEISQSLKNLARELKVPVLALSQLSRAVESRNSRKPQLADLRESGAIEQDADVVMFLYREDGENQENVTLDIQKHRNGPVGDIKLFFKGERIKFYGMEKSRQFSGISKTPDIKAAIAS